MEKSGASDVPASRLYLNIPLAGKTLLGDPLWNHASVERADCQCARSTASRRWRQRCRDVPKVRWPRKQPGLGIVDGDDGGALRAALIVGCLRYRLT